jgi:hypothetical protein
LGRHLDDRHQPPVFPAELRELMLITKSGRVRERPLDLFGSSESGR